MKECFVCLLDYDEKIHRACPLCFPPVAVSPVVRMSGSVNLLNSGNLTVSSGMTQLYVTGPAHAQYTLRNSQTLQIEGITWKPVKSDKPEPKPVQDLPPCPMCGGKWTHEFGCARMRPLESHKHIKEADRKERYPTICPYCGGILVKNGDKERKTRGRLKRQRFLCMECKRQMTLSVGEPLAATPS